MTELLQAYIDGHTIVHEEVEYTIEEDGMGDLPQIYAIEIEREEWEIYFKDQDQAILNRY